jgi:hypothetical protein
MNEVSIIINGVRYDSIPSEYPYSCKGCDMFYTTHCKFAMICKENDTIFKKSDKKFDV